MSIIARLNTAEKATIEKMLSHYKTNPVNETYLRSKFILSGHVLQDPFSKLRPHMELIKTEYTQEITLTREFWYSPEEFSYELYGTYELANILLYINDMATNHEFKRNTVKVIRNNKISDLIKLLKRVHDQTKIEHNTGIMNIPDLTIRKL